MNESFKVTKQGLENLRKRLEDLKRKYNKNAKALTIAYKNSNGDGAHDNAEFEYLLNQEKVIVSEINSLAFQIQNAVIIEETAMAIDCVNIDDIVAINMIMTPSIEREMIIQLVGGAITKIGEQVSINSPMGEAIYGSRVGETVSYEVNKKQFSVKILRKVNSKGVSSDK